MGGKRGRVLRNNYKGHMDETKGGWDQEREMERAGVGGSGSGGGKIETNVLEQQ